MTRKQIIYLSLILSIPLIIVVGSIMAVYSKQKTITANALTKINAEFIGELTIEDSYISPFTNFPYISIDLKKIKFYESKSMNSKPIYEAEDFYLGFSIWDILNGRYIVKKLKINDGHLDLIQYENGDINLLLAKGLSDEKEEEDSDEFKFELAGVALNKFDITYSNLSSKQDFVFRIAQLQTVLNFSDEHIYLDVVSNMIFDLDQDGQHTFFTDKKISLDLTLDYFEQNQTLKISPSEFELEDALLALSGQIKLLNKGVDIDLKFNGEKPDFNIFAAFLPKEVGEGLKKYKNEGEIYLIGSIEGLANDTTSPAISVEFGADKAYFLNTNIQKKVDDLRFEGFFTNGSERNLKTSEIQIENFHARPDEGVFKGQMIIKNFLDPFIKINLNADLDLEFLGDFFEIDGLQGIQGQVLLNMDFDELVDLDLITTSIGGTESSLQTELFLKNLSLKIPDYHLPVTRANAYAYMKNGKIILENLDFELGESDFSFSGELNDFRVLLHQNDKPLIANIRSKSKLINLKELTFTEKDSSSVDEEISNFEIKLAFETTGKEIFEFKNLPIGEFFIEDFSAQFKHYPHRLHDFHADILIREDNLILKDFRGEIDQSDFLFYGNVTNYQKWFEEQKVGDSSFEFDLISKKLQLNDLLSYNGISYLPKDYGKETITDLKLHGKVDLHYQNTFKSADFYLTELDGKLKVHPLKLVDFQGSVHFENNFLTLNKFSGKMGISDFDIDLGYFLGDLDSLQDTKPKKNYFNIQSKVLDLDALMGFESMDVKNDHQDSFNIFQLPFSDMDFSAKIGRMSYHTFWLEDIQGKMRTTSNHFLYVDTLGVRLADGTLGINGYFNGSNPEEIYFHSTMKAEKLDLDKLLIKFENFGQDYMINENLHGKISGTITSKFLVYPDLTPIIEKSEAKMDLTVFQGSLVNFAPLDAMSSYFGDRNLKNVRFDTLSNTFELKGGMLNIPKMNINSSLGYIELSGSQSLDLNMDYFIRVPLAMVTQVGFRALFGGKNQSEINPDQEDAIVFRDQDRKTRFVNINMKGNPDEYKISLRRDKK